MKKVGFYLPLFLFFLTQGLGAYNYPGWVDAQRKIFGNISRMEKLLPFYIKLANANEKDYTAQWKVGELCYYMWENYRFKGNLDGQWKVARIGYRYAGRALKIKPNGVEALFWYSADKGIWGILNGPLNSLQEAVRVRRYLERLRLYDPEAKFERGSWARILGKFYIFVSPFPVGFGNIEKGIRILKWLVEKYPDYGINRNFLAEAYMVTGSLKYAYDLLKENIVMLRKSDLSIYVNRRDLRVAKNLLALAKEYLEKGEGRVPSSLVLQMEYR